ncbi:N-acetyltransferase family protein [Brucellaceae bacterium C25G]
MTDSHIAPVTADHLEQLAILLSKTVEAGGSVSFMHPLSHEKATAFWQAALDDMDQGGRIILGAFDDDRLMATVSLVLQFSENQPHRAEIAKLMTNPDYRGRGLARELMLTAENLARQNDKTLLVLDTAEDGGASPLYEKLGYTKSGSIPDYALKPHGGLSATVLFWKKL